MRLTCGAGRPWMLCLWKSPVNQNHCVLNLEHRYSDICNKTDDVRKHHKYVVFVTPYTCGISFKVKSPPNCLPGLTLDEGWEGGPRYLEVCHHLGWRSSFSHNLHRPGRGSLTSHLHHSPRERHHHRHRHHHQYYYSPPGGEKRLQPHLHCQASLPQVVRC